MLRIAVNCFGFRNNLGGIKIPYGLFIIEWDRVRGGRITHKIPMNTPIDYLAAERIMLMGSSLEQYNPTLLQIGSLQILACFEGEGTSRKCFGVVLTYEELTKLDKFKKEVKILAKKIFSTTNVEKELKKSLKKLKNI